MNMHKDVKLISNLSSEKDTEIRSELVGSNSGGKRKSFWNVQIFDRSIIGALVMLVKIWLRQQAERGRCKGANGMLKLYKKVHPLLNLNNY